MTTPEPSPPEGDSENQEDKASYWERQKALAKEEKRA